MRKVQSKKAVSVCLATVMMFGVGCNTIQATSVMANVTTAKNQGQKPPKEKPTQDKTENKGGGRSLL